LGCGLWQHLPPPSKRIIGKCLEWLLKNFKGPLKMKGSVKKCLKSPASLVLTKAYSTMPLSGKSNLVRQSL
jgi:hypothetical protein